MDLSKVFPSRYLKADDLKSADRTVTIKSAKQELVGQGKDAGLKLVLSFHEHPRLLVCNKTNGTTIGKLYGSDTDLWIGKRITLFPTTVEFSGEQMAAIRVRPTAPTPSRKQPVVETPFDTGPVNDAEANEWGAVPTQPADEVPI